MKTVSLACLFRAQVRDPTKNDWSETIKEDLKDLKIGMNFDQIKKMSKLKWKKIVKNAMREKAFNDLIEIHDSYVKGEDLSYGKLESRTYLLSKNMTTSQKRLVFKMRTNMINVKSNYSHSYVEFSCPCCGEEEDTQEHMFITCKKLTTKLRKHLHFPPN